MIQSPDLFFGGKKMQRLTGDFESGVAIGCNSGR